MLLQQDNSRLRPHLRRQDAAFEDVFSNCPLEGIPQTTLQRHSGSQGVGKNIDHLRGFFGVAKGFSSERMLCCGLGKTALGIRKV
jgi:hypothetical protein